MPLESPAVDNLIQAINKAFSNVGGHLVKFSFANDADLKETASKNEFYQDRFFDSLFKSAEFISVLPDLKPSAAFDDIRWNEVSAFTLAGQWAQALMYGGAVASFPGKGKEAKKLCEDVADFIFDERYEDIMAYRTDDAWSDWFHDVAWDYSWLVIDKANSLAWVLVITDTD